MARSRDPGLHGRKPRFRSPRALARSYYDGYVDYTGRVKGFGVANLADAMGGYDWRLTTKNVWKVEQMLIDLPHRKIKTSIRRYRVLLKKYKAYRAAHNDRKPIYYRGRDKWEPLPQEFRRLELEVRRFIFSCSVSRSRFSDRRPAAGGRTPSASSDRAASSPS